MAFLDNSGDIILDAVLTDTGRFRLAKGDGSFKVTKFAFGDDEINYNSYNKLDTRGSAYYDLDILQTPILEAFTNNTSNMNSLLITIPRTNLLYLPIMRLNTKVTENKQITGAGAGDASGTFFVSVDRTTSQAFKDAMDANASVANLEGYIDGFETDVGSQHIKVDQGLHTTEVPISFALDPDLVETSYIVQMDHRLGSIASQPNATTVKNPRYIDDDNIAHYFLSHGVDGEFINTINQTDPDSALEAEQVIDGPRGTTLMFTIVPSIELASSSFLFTEIGDTMATFTPQNGSAITDLKFIDTIIKVQGATTGYSIDIPVRFVKK